MEKLTFSELNVVILSSVLNSECRLVRVVNKLNFRSISIVDSIMELIIHCEVCDFDIVLIESGGELSDFIQGVKSIKSFKGYKSKPIIVYGSNVGEGGLLDMDKFAYLLKPVRSNVLVKAIHEMITDRKDLY